MIKTPIAFVGTRGRDITIHPSGCDVSKLLPLHHAYGCKVLSEHASQLSKIELLLVSKLEHEIDHLHRFLGTTLGIFLNKVFCKQVSLVMREIEGAQTDIQLPFPMTGECMQEFSALSRLERSMMGTTLQVSQMSQELFSDCRWICSFLGDSDLLKWSPNDSIAPLSQTAVGTILRPTAISGYSILEYLGLSREVGLRRKFGLFYEETKSMIATQAYQQLGQYWKGNTSTRNSSTDQVALPSELYLASDLACWIPIGPHKLVKRPSGRAYSWEDVHPGHRFAKIVQLAESIDSIPTNAPLDDTYENWYRTNVLRLCNQLDWPTPEDLATIWLSHLSSLSSNLGGNTEWIQEDRGRTEGTKRMLRLRLTHPAKAAQGYWPAFNEESLWFSCVVLQDKGKQTVLGFDDSYERRDHPEYEHPLAFSLSAAIDLLVLKRPESLMGEDLVQRYKTQANKAVRDLSNYAKTHFGFSINSGRTGTGA